MYRNYNCYVSMINRKKYEDCKLMVEHYVKRDIPINNIFCISKGCKDCPYYISTDLYAGLYDDESVINEDMIT